jgi:hypothetical protein
MAESLLVLPAMLEWRSILDGAEIAVLAGNPEIAGLPYVIRFRTRREIAVPAHWHPEDENITVLEGPFALGLGECFAQDALKKLPTGSYAYVPKETRHFASYGVGTVVQVSGVGPFQTFYVDPPEDLGDEFSSKLSRQAGGSF